MPEELRGTYAGLAHPGDHRPPARPGRHRDRADAGAPVHARPGAARPGTAELLGLQHLRIPGTARRLRVAPAKPGATVAEFKAMVRAFHEAGIEVILDVVYNHTAEGNHLGPTINFRGIDNAAYYRLVDDDPRYYMDYTGTGQQPQRAPPAHPAADHGLAAVLGDRDARRRVPLRPRLDAGPRTARRGPAVGVLRPGAAGPGGQPGEADRRAVGRRRGRLPGRQLPRPVDRVERQVPRHRPRLLARRAGDAGRVRVPAHRLLGPVRGHRPPARRVSINFVTAHDGFTLRDLVSYNEKHNEANGEDNQRRREPQPVLELRRRGPHRRPGDPRTARPPAAATSWPR